MRYNKPALSFDQQAELLIERGVEAEKPNLIEFLRQVNYYRVSGYLYPFKESADSEGFIEGTILTEIKKRYYFDSELRLLILSAVEKIEVTILRTLIVEQMTMKDKHGPFWFLDISKFKDLPHFPESFHDDFIEFNKEKLLDKTTDFITGYRNKYTEEEALPFWIIVEKMTFGHMAQLIGNLQRSDRIELARKFDLPYKVFGSWIQALNFIRNACAHHDRVWNRYIPIQPRIPDRKTIPGFYQPVMVKESNKNPRVFPILVIIQYILNYIEPKNQFGGKLQSLLEDYQGLPYEEIGFPKNWELIPFWTEINT